MKQLSIWTRSVLLLCFIVFCSSNGWAWSDFALKGDFSGWDPIYLTKDNDNHFTGTIDASEWDNNRVYQFKFYNEENGGATKNHWGTTSQNIDFTSNSTCTIDEQYDNGNMTWKHNDAYSTYTVDAEYKENRYWHVTITGVSSEQKYTINISAGTGGTVSPSGSQQVGATGINITANPSTGYRFKEWTVDGGASVGSTTSATSNLTATATGTVTANFEQSSTPTPTPSNTDYAYYLIGNLMDTDGNTINTSDRKFRFFKNTNGTYYFDVPATLTVNTQIVAVAPNGTSKIYGPASGNQTFGISDNTSVTYSLANNNSHFTANDRGLVSSGIYSYTLTVDANGNPTSVTVSHDKTRLVAYYWPEATTKNPNPTAQPTYTVRKSDGGSDNRYFGNVNLEQGQHCWVISNITKNADNNTTGTPLITVTKLYKQGNGGGNVITRKADDGSNAPSGVDYTHVYPYYIHQSNKGNEYKANQPGDGFTFGDAAAYTLEYNPSKGTDEVTKVSENKLIGGEVLKVGFGELGTPITSMNIIGTGIPASGSWDISKKQPMTYNQELQCYEYTFTKTTSESTSETFRFVANNDWSMNWEENGTADTDKARVPYNDDSKDGHAATDSDPNYVKKAGAVNADNDERADAGTHDIILNRPAGEWTIRFYIKTATSSSGNDYTVEYYYTITGSPLSPYDVSIYGGRVLCSFSSDKDLEIPTGYRAYVAHSFALKQEGSNNTQDGTVSLYRIKYIPANMGVILYGNNVAINGTNVTVPFHDYAGEKFTDENLWYYYETHNGQQFKNYLVAAPNGCTLSENGELNQEWLDKGKYYYLARYFAFTWFSKTKYGNLYTWTEPTNAPKQGTLDSDAATAAGLNLPAEIKDYASFFRAKGTVGKNRAYLRLPEDVMNYNGQALVQNQDEDSKLFAKTSLRFDDFFYEDDFNEGEVTDVNSVKNAFKTTKDNAYYNLQGMKVSNPTKGLYIINGKKVIIK